MERLAAALDADSQLDVTPPLDAAAIDAIERAPRPKSGAVNWRAPESYRAFLRETGRFTLGWYSMALDSEQPLELLDARGIATVSRVVYLPRGVGRGDGRTLTTNHLVPFAGEPGGRDEWAFCFDVAAAGPEYPVYYHHQDQPRARYATGEWDDATPSAPDFASFGDWLGWLIEAVEAQTDPEELGQPTARQLFARTR